MGNGDENKGVEIKLSCFVLVFARWATGVRTATPPYGFLNFSGSLMPLYLSVPPSKLSFSQPTALSKTYIYIQKICIFKCNYLDNVNEHNALFN